jgi:hypothetical protein
VGSGTVLALAVPLICTCRPVSVSPSFETTKSNVFSQLAKPEVIVNGVRGPKHAQPDPPAEAVKPVFTPLRKIVAALSAVNSPVNAGVTQTQTCRVACLDYAHGYCNIEVPFRRVFSGLPCAQ